MEIEKILNELNIKYEEIIHEPLYTVQDAKIIKGKIKGLGCKNLFLKERKGEKRTFLVIVPMEKQVDLKELKERLGTSKLEFASSAKMQDLLQTTPGNVSIFNLIFDKDKKVNIVLDQDLFDSKLLAFHPLYNGMSIFLKEKEVRKFLDFCDRDYLVGAVPTREALPEKTNVLSA